MRSQASSEPLQVVSTVEAIESALTDRILAGHLPPGTPLREVALAGELGVGRHSLRAALDRLAARGLVRRHRNRGAEVARLDAADVLELAEARAAVERAAARRIVADPGTVLAPTRDAMEGLRQACRDGSWRHTVDAHLEVHRAIVIASGNDRLVRIHDGLLTETALLLVQIRAGYEDREQLVGEHDHLLAELSSGDLGRAEDAIERHLAASQRLAQDLEP